MGIIGSRRAEERGLPLRISFVDAQQAAELHRRAVEPALSDEARGESLNPWEGKLGLIRKSLRMPLWDLDVGRYRKVLAEAHQHYGGLPSWIEGESIIWGRRYCLSEAQKVMDYFARGFGVRPVARRLLKLLQCGESLYQSKSCARWGYRREFGSVVFSYLRTICGQQSESLILWGERFLGLYQELGSFFAVGRLGKAFKILGIVLAADRRVGQAVLKELYAMKVSEGFTRSDVGTLWVFAMNLLAGASDLESCKAFVKGLRRGPIRSWLVKLNEWKPLVPEPLKAGFAEDIERDLGYGGAWSYHGFFESLLVILIVCEFTPKEGVRVLEELGFEFGVQESETGCLHAVLADCMDDPSRDAWLRAIVGQKKERQGAVQLDS